MWLVADADTPIAVLAAVVYGLATIALYFTSSSYHLYARAGRAREVMQRLDHSMIYVLIVGTYTPVCLLALTGSVRWALLAIVWTGALVGVLFTLLAYDRFPHMTFILSLILGWAALLALPDLLERPGSAGARGDRRRPLHGRSDPVRVQLARPHRPLVRVPRVLARVRRRRRRGVLRDEPRARRRRVTVLLICWNTYPHMVRVTVPTAGRLVSRPRRRPPCSSVGTLIRTWCG